MILTTITLPWITGLTYIYRYKDLYNTSEININYSAITGTHIKTVPRPTPPPPPKKQNKRPQTQKTQRKQNKKKHQNQQIK